MLAITTGAENPTSKEMEIRNIKEDVIVENAEIIAYKMCSQLADAISVFQQNTEEEVSMFNWIMTTLDVESIMAKDGIIY